MDLWRARAYAFLAAAFTRPSEALLRQLLENRPLAEYANLPECLCKSMAQLLNLCEDFAAPREASAEPDRITELEIEYNRLFFGPGKVLAPPYESVYRTPDGLVMGQCASDVAREYAEAGLALSSELKSLPGGLPDHVAAELEYMSYLCQSGAVRKLDISSSHFLTFSLSHFLSRGRSRSSEEHKWLRQQDAFLREHLRVWIPQFCDRIISSGLRDVCESPKSESRNPNSEFYPALAKLTRDFVQWDAARLRRHIAIQSHSDSTKDGTKRERKEVEWQVSIDSSMCTLCEMCSTVCPTQALKLTPACRNRGAVRRNRLEIALVLNAKQCNGCEQCVQLCPEAAIQVEQSESPNRDVRRARIAGAASPTEEIAARSEMALCSKCAAPIAPRAMLAKLRTCKPNSSIRSSENLAQVRPNDVRVSVNNSDGDIESDLSICPECRRREFFNRVSNAFVRNLAKV